MTKKSQTRKRLTMKYVPLETATLWDENPKEHDIESIITSIQRNGFRDPPEYDAAIDAIVAGNGRITCLNLMRDRHEEVPLYCDIDSKGRWLVPILFGADSESVAAAKQYAVDHNVLTLGINHITGAHVNEMFRSYDMERLFPPETPESEMPITISHEIMEQMRHSTEKKDVSLDNFEDSLAEGFADAAQFGVRIQLIVDLTKDQADQAGLKEGLRDLAETYGFQYKVKSRK